MAGRFTCPTCRATRFEQIVVRLPSGGLRQTDLFCCCACRTVFYDPATFHAGQPAGSESRNPDFKTYGK